MIQTQMAIDLTLPRPLLLNGASSISGPTYDSFKARFGDAFPKPVFVSSELGDTAVYDVAPPSGKAKRRILMVHGLNTPGVGLWPLSKELQALDPDAHVVIFDLWGHGLSSTPLAAHTPQLVHSQILQVLGFKHWSSAHFVGYSFGGSTAVSFAINNPWATESVILVAPVGIMRKEDFSTRMQELLDDSGQREQEAQDEILSYLEGGALVVPEDWKSRTEKGEVVAQAIRQWERDNHPGFSHSILSMFRYGGVTGCEERFRQFSHLPTKKAGVLADGDFVCNKKQLNDLGLDDVVVAPDANHDFVRDIPGKVAAEIHQFWRTWDVEGELGTLQVV